MNKSVGRSFYATVALLVLLLLAVSMLGGTKAVVAGRDENRPVNLIDVPILNYHKVDTFHHPLSILPDDFEKQMAYLQENGFHSITPDQLLAYIKFAKPLPDKPVMITFDDGYLDNFTNAFPIMQRYGFTGTIFLASGLVNQDERFLTWDQVRQMKQAGFVFGSHTVNHMDLTKLDAEQIQAELTESRDEMEAQLGEKPRYFAYPTGAYNLQVEQMVRQAGYRAAFTIRYGQVGADSDIYALERIPIFQGTRTFRSFLIRLNAAPLLERMGLIRN